MREATLEDLDLIEGMAVRFGEEANMPVNIKDTMESIQEWIEGEGSVVLISDEGMAAAGTATLFFNRDILIAQEYFWWVDREHRSKGVGQKFLTALENWAKENGATALLMIALMSAEPEKATRLYMANGYVPFENNFIKYL